MEDQIYSQEVLNNQIDEKGYVNHDLIINESDIKSLGSIKKVYGNLRIYSNSLEDFGELNYVKGDLWISTSSGKSITSLGNLERVGGSVTLKGSNIIDLGKLWRVGGKLNLRDTEIKDLENLKYVKTLFLSKKLKEINVEHIVTKKIRYWNDSQIKIIEEKDFKNVGGSNLRYSVRYHDNNETKDNTIWSRRSDWNEIDTGYGFSLGTFQFPIPQIRNHKYYISPEALEEQNKNYINYKSQISLNQNFLDDYKKRSPEIFNFRSRLIYDLINEYRLGLIEIETFIDQTIFYEKVFSSCEVQKFEFFPTYKKLNLNSKIENLLNNSSTNYLSYSQLHELELRFNKRYYTGKIIVSQVGSLNKFVRKNINEYYTFIDGKLDKIYGENYSLFQTLFGVLKSVDETNSEFPRKFRYSHKEYFNYSKLMKLRKDGFKYLKNNIEDDVFQKYINGVKKFEETLNIILINKVNFNELNDFTKKLWNGGEIWLSYDQNPLSYCYDNPSENNFCYFINNIINKIFNLITFSFQNDFRESKGLPKIGEGWVSETELFYLIKDNLIGIEVIHHGNPNWLGRQHVDIWIPKHKIGIEYQGVQHDKPVDFFGGEEGFKKSTERDQRKKKLFAKNNSVLIEVREGYNIKEVINSIKEEIQKHD